MHDMAEYFEKYIAFLIERIEHMRDIFSTDLGIRQNQLNLETNSNQNSEAGIE